MFWGIDQTIHYGSETLLTSSGIVDTGISLFSFVMSTLKDWEKIQTGATLLLIATDAFNKYRNAVGAVFDDNTGLLRINSTQFDRLESLFFQISGVSHT